MHLLRLTFRFQLSFREDDSVRRLSCQPRIGHASSKNAVNFFICAHNETRSIAVGVNNSDRSPVSRATLTSILSLARERRVLRTPFRSLRNQKKLFCVWIFHDGPRRKIGDIDILVLFRQIRTRDHAFPAWDRNCVGQTSFCFFHIRG